MFGIGVLFAAVLLFLGATQYSFPLLYLGWFVILLLGMFTLSEGIALEDGTVESPLGSHNFVTTYDIRTTTNDPIVNIIGNTFFYLPFGCILLTTFVALRR